MDRLSPLATQTRFRLELPTTAFPFRRELSLAPLIAAWEAAATEPGIAGDVARAVCRGLERAPELRAPIEDLSVLDRHRDLVETLMSRVFPVASWEMDYGAAAIPFHLRAVHATPSFRRLLLDEQGFVQGWLNLDAGDAARGRLLYAYDAILRAHYGMTLDMDDQPFSLGVRDPDSGLERHFRIQLDVRFLEARALAPIPTLDEVTRQRLNQGGAALDLLRELFPPDTFAFSGFTVLRATEVTDQEMLSAIQRDLLDKESIVSTERFEALQDKLCTLLRRHDLRLGLAAFQDGRVFILNYTCQMEHGCIFADTEHRQMSDFIGSVYERAVTQGTPLVVDDLRDEPRRTQFEDALLTQGIRNILVAPLHYQNRAIGTLELSSPNPGDLGPASLIKLREVLPLFAMAVRRSLDELEARVQAVIKEKCTAIHPSVEWRFRRAVLDSIEEHDGETTELEPIVFRDVHTLYAATDIRGSSVERNLATQADLGVHLRLAFDVVEAARAARPLPILDETGYRIERHARQIEQTLTSGDEVTVLAFLRREVEPLFARLAEFGPAVRERLEAYRAALDPELGTVYRQRRDYEDSMTLVADTVSAYLDAEEELAQSMFPHYFERLRTDGVDHTIYVGGSLVESGEFDVLYLRNLRLWQLMVTCGIARRTEAIRPRLTVPLATTHLVLAHHAPLSIRFRFDERRFDVEGAYNIRYEVIKKRIDKAVVEGTRERVTQPGKLAIVYSQPSEAAEYRGYLEYLGARGYVTGEVEDLELEELQGVHGLRALRVEIDLSAPAPEVGVAAREAGQTPLRR
jgi:hypothetical protein